MGPINLGHIIAPVTYLLVRKKSVFPAKYLSVMEIRSGQLDYAVTADDGGKENNWVMTTAL